MNFQYIHDGAGKTAGVFIPIKIWNKLKEKYHDIELEDTAELHQWQKDIIDDRLEEVAKGNEKFQDFETAIEEIENDL